METAICSRLRLGRSSRKPDSPWKQALSRRKSADLESQQKGTSGDDTFNVGDTVTCRWGDGVLSKVDHCEGKYEITMSAADTQFPYEFTDLGPKGARARHRFVGFGAQKRRARCDMVPPEVLADIKQFYNETIPTSPCARDYCSRRYGPHQVQYARIMWRRSSWDDLWEQFKKQYPTSASLLCDVNLLACPFVLRDNAPWNMRKGGGDSCLCQNCENCSKYTKGRMEAARLLMSILSTSTEKDEGDSPVNTRSTRARESQPVNSLVHELVDVLKQPNKYEMCLALTKNCSSINDASSTLENRKPGCLLAGCNNCGFSRLWSKGLRKTLVLEDESSRGWKLRPGSHSIFSQVLTWERYVYRKNSQSHVHACRVSDEDEAYETKKASRSLEVEVMKGTLIDFLDDFEGVVTSHLEHRAVLSKQTKAARQHRENRRPGCLSPISLNALLGTVEN